MEWDPKQVGRRRSSAELFLFATFGVYLTSLIGLALLGSSVSLPGCVVFTGALLANYLDCPVLQHPVSRCWPLL